MNDIEKSKLYTDSWRHFGADTQIDICIEEFSELIQAFIKARRNGVVFTHNVYEEIADVTICLEQIEHHLKSIPRASSFNVIGDNGNQYDSVLEAKMKKLERFREFVTLSVEHSNKSKE